MAKPPIEFLFDYTSPWAFLANALIPKKLPDAVIVHTPVYLRGFEAFSQGMPYSSAKLAYLLMDFQRCAAIEEVAVAAPATFPFNAIHALRGALAAHDDGSFARYHDAVFRAAWQESRDISTPAAVAALASEIGLPAVAEAVADPKYKTAVRTNTESAVKRGAFGVPSFFLGDELFWGHDRMDYLARAHAAI
jgi:2-hydroxychromene-2-carboxylate isomerase